VANLLLVRVEGRRQELAIRTAMGAGRGRIAADLLFESILLGLMGSLLGLALAYGALRILVAMAPTGIPRIHEIGIDLQSYCHARHHPALQPAVRFDSDLQVCRSAFECQPPAREDAR